ncbi:glycosyltransferase [Arthrobacter sp. TMS1-12-1]
MTRWTALIARHGVGVCSVGQIRTDKNLPMLALAASKAGSHVAIMGQDTGGLADVKAELSLLGLGEDLLFPGYYPIEEMAALVSSCGLVALPYSVASQSGVAALAHAYGAKVIGHRVGGLGEQLDFEVESLDPAIWSKVLQRAIFKMANHQPERIPRPGRPEHTAKLLESLRTIAFQN